MGVTDRIIRCVIGIALIILGIFVFKLWWVALIGLIPVITSIIGYCPVYVPFKIKTCKNRK